MSESSEQLARFTPLCDAEDLWAGEMREFKIGNRAVLVIKLDGGEIVALQGTCPHQRIPLAEGALDGTVLTCRAHLWQFDVTSGKGINPTGCRLARYPVQIDGGVVSVAIKGVTESARLLG